jgi:membrane protease subunit (stomatin/prohibitin family)
MLRNCGSELTWSGASGTFDVRIINPWKIIQKTKASYTTQQVRDLVNMMISMLGDAINQSKTPIGKIVEDNDEVAAFIHQSINTELNSYGLELTNLSIKTHGPQSQN